MMNKQEAINKIIETFNICFKGGVFEEDFSEDKEDFKYICDGFGMKFSKLYHLHGIGNNNECYIYIPEIDKDGFEIEKKVLEFHYTYPIYGKRMIIWLQDFDGNTLASSGRDR